MISNTNVIKWYRRLSLRQITVAIMRAIINVTYFVRIVCTYKNKIFDCTSVQYVIEKTLCIQRYIQLLYLKILVVIIQILIQFLQI